MLLLRDRQQSEGASALEQLKSVPLATLAKASQALNASQKRKRGGKPAHDEKTLAAAKEAFQELRGKRKGRTTPRFAQVQEDEPANANQKYQQHEPRAKRKELEHRAHKHA